MRAEEAVDHAAARVEDDVHRAVEAAHRRHLVDVGAHRARVGAVVRLRRGDEGAVVRLDRLVRDDARQDQLAAAARAPVVRLGLADRDLDVARARPRCAAIPACRARRRRRTCSVGVARLVLEELDAEPLHPVEVLAAELLLDVRLGHREDLAVRADDDGIGVPAASIASSTGGQQPRLRRGPELVVDDRPRRSTRRRGSPRSAAR